MTAGNGAIHENAGVKVTLHSASDAPEELRPLIKAIQHDEAHWCAVLVRAIQRLDGTPSRNTGTFYEKVMAINEIPARLAFLNRGQGWVVRKLKTLLPIIDDQTIRDDLTVMLESHVRNFALVTEKLPAPIPDGRGPTPPSRPKIRHGPPWPPKNLV